MKTAASSPASRPSAPPQCITDTASARLLHDRARDIDPRRITPADASPSLTAHRYFGRDVLAPQVHRVLLARATDLTGSHAATV
jgi:hypothetical protein